MSSIYDSLPLELIDHMLGFCSSRPDKITTSKIKEWGKNSLKISLVDKSFYRANKNEMAKIKEIFMLVMKYTSYNDEYDKPAINYFTGKEYEYGGNPQLLDALFTGCRLSYADSTFNKYNPEIEEDIKALVRLTPESITCIIGELRCRRNVFPLAAACANNIIPLHIIELLLENGADPNKTYLLNCESVSILYDFKVCDESGPRVDAIRELLEAYGGKEICREPEYMSAKRESRKEIPQVSKDTSSNTSSERDFVE